MQYLRVVIHSGRPKVQTNEMRSFLGSYILFFHGMNVYLDCVGSFK